jgi:hypothetical protein
MKDAKGHGSDPRGGTAAIADQHGITGPAVEPTVQAYHGASAASLRSAAKYGLLPGSDKSVWVASKPSSAGIFAGAHSENGKGVIYELAIPKSEYDKFRSMDFGGGTRTASTNKSIPSQWIKGYHEVLNTKGPVKLGPLKGLSS